MLLKHQLTLTLAIVELWNTTKGCRYVIVELYFTVQTIPCRAPWVDFS